MTMPVTVVDTRMQVVGNNAVYCLNGLQVDAASTTLT